MSDIPMLTGPNGGELVFDTASGAVVELLTSGGSFPTHPATGPTPFVPAESRLATLEADLAASRERSAALAAALKVAEKTIGEAIQAASVMNLNRAGCFLSAYVLCGKDYEAILAAHDAAIERKAKVEALEKLYARLVEQHYFVLGSEASCEIRDVIAALKEGGKG